MSLMDFVVYPPGYGRSVANFRGWDAHEAQLRCPDEVDGDILTYLLHGAESFLVIYEYEVPGGALNPSSTALSRP
jgi:hypothetical protein